MGEILITKGDYNLVQKVMEMEADENNCAFAVNATADGRIYVEFHGSEEVSLVEVDLPELEGISEMFVNAIRLIKQKL